ncbi:hypothetical protein A3G67_00670 [Candidatus Roizmanbacteria bacterium RIFCSPLOWO2_12_FULL_40_12]|uniref:Fumarate reductase/succinate dehydrogenase flavoprotein subunit n=1 Tax=Candidatus Roizmanbacteria bacterium RIFCSPLOWO2_01_FULL_40_42 TaxID=1802066 RepID=A0A1F7J6B1_9BACT|nr:MAG: hypothetical protein A2W49_00465 [Candidatus Roizmanbacteria bacterium RIFCSPHIGHO2_12_41_18]OGK51133.1 MAG: hypothetical protein A3B50_05045 [Candidatus Roizmanbacteria bacterium RIFCSPLOWO2_01_FULL_40_42]OGK58485.1 MAG: hypothetical protein A3H84_04265 [Candidatus Roizmanbacteria bacterium RIFCSPLOWO2_02_FULL_40_13]OGK60377.1 MAG: hypothetical protein A3G67_00670 [Candidatus Roizmanbacteria bacterium RIFCSPLOWO2_12_FULL_40_12]
MKRKARLQKLRKKNLKTIKTDVLVIGAGGAGLRAAIEAKRNGAKVLVISKESMGEAHTKMAMGGLNVAIKPPATAKQHLQDTIKGGWEINNYKMAKIFAREMPQRIYDLEDYGVNFDKLPDGSFYTWAGGKQSAPLNLCAGDYTGREMMRGLVAEAKKLGIDYKDKQFVTKLLVKNQQVIGALTLDQKTTVPTLISAKVTVVATGGAGMLYLINTNEPTNTGEGYAWGLDAGARLVDMEMVQIHPTGMAYPPEKKGRLITEKVRGHGGILRNKFGERFMKRYQPKRLELAGRDEVSRAIYEEIEEGRGTENGGVWLDITHWKKGEAEKFVPEVFQAWKEVGVDITKKQMEISPSMHHMMGGIDITEWGETGVKGLLAVGESTRNIHGANRLGGNSLAEGQVFGRRVGLRAAQNAKKRKLAVIPKKIVEKELDRVNSFITQSDGESPEKFLLELKTVMWNNVGLIKDKRRLDIALIIIKDLQRLATDVVARNKKELQDALELQEMLKVAEAIIISALKRTESRGAHYRLDYPKMDKKWLKNIAVYKNKKGQLKTRVLNLVK